jgi:hypothetical protein
MNILLMTSTISPAVNTFLLSVTDPAERLEHYKRSLVFYARHLTERTFDRLVFVENSGYPLDDLFEVAVRAEIAELVEFVSYKADIPPDNSRYYLEINLLCFAMKNSNTIKRNQNSLIWKITGRYIITNIASIVSAAPRMADLYINVRNFPRPTLDFYLIGYRADSFYRHIGRDIEDYRTTRNGEDILREKIEAGKFVDVEIIPRFGRTPRLFGVRGFDGAQYGRVRDTLKYAVRSSLNAIAPSLWI